MEKYTRENLRKGLADVGLREGDLVFFQSRLYGLGMPEGIKDRDGLCRFFLDTLLEIIGPEGTLVVPTYSTQVARYDKPFIVEETVPNYGLFPEYVFKHKDFVRSLNPLISVAATGRLKEKVCRSGSITNYGARSPFDVMAANNAKNIFLGIEPWEANSVAHYIEMHFGVPYIYNKLLKWRSIEKGRISNKHSVAMVRYLSYETKYNFPKYQAKLFERGVIKTSDVGGGRIYAVELKDMIEVGYDCLEKDPYFFLAEPPEFQYGDVPYDGPSYSREAASGKTEDSRPVCLNLEKYKGIAPEFARIAKAVIEKLDENSGKMVAEHLQRRNEHFFTLAEDIVSSFNAGAGASSLTSNDIPDLFEKYLKNLFDSQDLSAISLASDFEPGILMLTRVLWEPWWRLYNFARSNFFAPFLLTSGKHAEFHAGSGWFALLARQFGAGNVFSFQHSSQGAAHAVALMKSQNIDRSEWAVEQTESFDKLQFADGEISTAAVFSLHEMKENAAGFLKELRRALCFGGAAYVEAACDSLNETGPFADVHKIRNMIQESGLKIECAMEVDMKIGGSRPGAGFGAVVRK
ncbi:MAG: AAC(3) family N-acetyltransferase [bacterium]